MSLEIKPTRHLFIKQSLKWLSEATGRKALCPHSLSLLDLTSKKIWTHIVTPRHTVHELRQRAFSYGELLTRIAEWMNELSFHDYFQIHSPLRMICSGGPCNEYLATSSWLLEEQICSEQLVTDCGQPNHQLLTHLHALLLHFKRTECILLKRSVSAFSLLAQITGSFWKNIVGLYDKEWHFRFTQCTWVVTWNGSLPTPYPTTTRWLSLPLLQFSMTCEL